MGEKATLAKARLELEELYLGIPDESVNLTFQDLVDVKKHAHLHPLHALSSSSSSSSSSPSTAAALDPISENKPAKSEAAAASPVFRKLPSLDFSRGLRASNLHHPLKHSDQPSIRDSPIGHRSFVGEDGNDDEYRYGHSHASSGRNTHLDMRGTGVVENSSTGHDDMMSMSMSMSMSVSMATHGQRQRPGIPHSNLCTICSTYIYIFRRRCLVCGRVYCRQCASIGMGEMTEGRKCVECLGRRFSQRYIQRAGQIGCCSRCPSTVKQAELKWAEKGPRRTAERAYGRGRMASRSRSPVTSRTPTRAHPSSISINASNPPSFVYSPYSPHSQRHHIPF